MHGLGAVLYAVATHPEQWQALRREPSLARMAFDEAVRWQSPVQTFFRTATRDIQIGDTCIADGKKILMFLGAANREPRPAALGRPRQLRPDPRPVRTRGLRHGRSSRRRNTSPASRRRPC